MEDLGMSSKFKFPDHCRAQGFGECSEKMSKEHVISDGLLKSLGMYRWVVDGKVKKLGSGSFVTRTLCEKHNRELSKFDAEAIKFLTTWVRLSYGGLKETDAGKVYEFDGYLVEKWFAKTFLNFIIFKQQAFGDKSPNLFNFAVRHINKVVHSDQEGRSEFESPFGLYLVSKPFKEKSKPQINWGPVYAAGFHYSAKNSMWNECERPLYLSIHINGLNLIGFFNVDHYELNAEEKDGNKVLIHLKTLDALKEENAKYRSFHIGLGKMEPAGPSTQLKLRF